MSLDVSEVLLGGVYDVDSLLERQVLHIDSNPRRTVTYRVRTNLGECWGGNNTCTLIQFAQWARKFQGIEELPKLAGSQ